MSDAANATNVLAGMTSSGTAGIISEEPTCCNPPLLCRYGQPLLQQGEPPPDVKILTPSSFRAGSGSATEIVQERTDMRRMEAGTVRNGRSGPLHLLEFPVGITAICC